MSAATFPGDGDHPHHPLPPPHPEFTARDDVTSGQIIGHIVDPADGRGHQVTATGTGRIFACMHGLTLAPGAELAAIAAPRTPGA